MAFLSTAERLNRFLINTEPIYFDGEFGKRERLDRLGRAYLERPIILEGVDRDAKESNKVVLEAIKAASVSFGERSDDLFGIHLAGSRVKGYHTASSDVDLVLVAPPCDVGGLQFVAEAIESELEKRDLQIGIDTMVGAITNPTVEIDPREFIYTVDNGPEDVAALFGFTVYENPNLLLARLAALEIVNASPAYEWDVVTQRFNWGYLGQRKPTVYKLSERFEVPVSKTQSIFTRHLFQQRYKSFGLRRPKGMLQELRRWYRSSSGLEKYCMHDVYAEVMEELSWS